MYKKTITCEDYNGVEKSFDCYFNISKPELLKLEIGDNPISEILRKVITEKNTKCLHEAAYTLITASYGEKDPDGIHFRKSADIVNDFIATPIYEALYMSLVSDLNEFSEFISHVLPSSVIPKENAMAELSENA